MCLTKSDLLGGLYKIPSRIDLDLGKKNVNKNTLGITAKNCLCNCMQSNFQLNQNHQPLIHLTKVLSSLVSLILIHHLFINFWQKAIYIYANKAHSSIFKDIPFISAHIFPKAI